MLDLDSYLNSVKLKLLFIRVSINQFHYACMQSQSCRKDPPTEVLYNHHDLPLLIMVMIIIEWNRYGAWKWTK